MAGRRTVLIVDDEPNMCWLLKETLGHRFNVLTAVDGEAGLRILDEEGVDLAILDLRLPDMDGLEVLRRVRLKGQSLPVLMITAYGSIQNAVQAMKLGANDYIVKPFDPEALDTAIQRILTIRSVQTGQAAARAVGPFPEQMVAKSTAMSQVVEMVRQVASTQATVLIQGESGTGKELVVKMLHDLSPNPKGSFVAVNCAALPESLLEAELFGFEAGAFTGASRAKPGQFELAHNGTLFLDEIGDLPLILQGKLLRVLEEKTVNRLGSTRSIKVNVRVVSATNQDLVRMVKAEQFREDLYYRLAVILVYVPPLRERRKDIVPLVEQFLSDFAQRYDRAAPALSQESLEALTRYSWPGNVRELRNLVERLVILRSGATVTIEDLPSAIVDESSGYTAPTLRGLLDGEKAKVEREVVQQALQMYGGNRTKAASYLGVSRRWIQRKVHDYNL